MLVISNWTILCVKISDLKDTYSIRLSDTFTIIFWIEFSYHENDDELDIGLCTVIHWIYSRSICSCN